MSTLIVGALATNNLQPLDTKYLEENSNFKTGTITFFPISYSNLTISLNVGTPTTNIIEITYPVSSQEEASSPLLYTSIRPSSNLIPNSGSPPSKSFVRTRRVLESGMIVYQHVIRYFLSEFSGSTEMLIDMYTLQQNSLTVYVSVAADLTNQQVSYPTYLVDDFFPGIFLYSAFVGFALLLIIGSVFIWFFCYRKRKNPAALGEVRTRFCKNCSIMCVGMLFYFCSCMFAASAPIFAMNRSLTKCCANYQSIYEINSGTNITTTSNGYMKVAQMSELNRCATLVPFQHLFWFGQQLDTEETLGKFQCFGDLSKTFTLYHYDYIIYVAIFCGVTICIFPLFHCMITVYANKLYMLTKEQHQGEVTVKFSVSSL